MLILKYIFSCILWWGLQKRLFQICRLMCGSPAGLADHLATQPQGPPAARSPPTSLPSVPGSAHTQPLPTPTTQTSARRIFPLFSTTSFSCRRHRGWGAHQSYFRAKTPLQQQEAKLVAHLICEMQIDHNSLEKQQEMSGSNEATPHTTLAYICSWGPNPGT